MSTELGAGLLIARPWDGRVLLVRRSPWMKEPGHWAPPGGMVEAGETPREAALREAREELGGLPPVKIVSFEPYWRATGPFFAFATYLAELPRAAESWSPILNRENDALGWFLPGELPTPLLSGVREALDALMRDLSAAPRTAPALGIAVRDEDRFSACKIVNLDRSSRKYLSMDFTLMDRATDRAFALTVDVEDGVPLPPLIPRCGRGDWERIVENYQRALRANLSLGVLCVEGLSREGALEFALADLERGVSAEAKGVIAVAVDGLLRECLTG